MIDCPSGCGRPVQSGKLLCLPCWREVPAAQQRDVMRTWRAKLRASAMARSTPAERLAVNRDYRAAVDAALASIA